jgi:GTPase SAR1 family protein
MIFQSNPQLEIAFDYVRYTNKNIFLTGKAGTGKTTFLHQIKQESTKRIVVVAPTGVAAINAGGVTIHSFFQLPFGPYLPDSQQNPAQQRKFNREKINLIKSLDLLVIDEISMVRADLLDGIDDVLRRYRDFSKPFGGVQLLMIGDLHQLSPVVKDDEWNLLRPHYDTAYFFGSRALQKTQPVAIELKHIYRQSDTTFIDLLNKVRDNKIDTEVLDTLNSRYIPNFEPKEGEAYITLTSHNASALEINSEKLALLKTTSLKFTAKVTGDFPAFSYPTEEVLEFKTNAQVMFVKNDISRDKLYYNGKIGKVTKIEDGVIFVKCPTDSEEIAVSPTEWKNVKYTLNESTKEVEEDEIGTFTQYPLKLAWAITIHKSQGLTFERAIIDANAAFAHGQVYVALSRCKSFEGIVLRSKIGTSSVKTDYVVRNYTEEVDKNTPNENDLKQSKIDFQQTLISELFDFKTLKKRFDQNIRFFLENESIIIGSALHTLKAILQTAETDVFAVAERFKPQILSYFGQQDLPEDNQDLQMRIQKAAVYFEAKLKDELLSNVAIVSVETDNQTVKKAALENLNKLKLEIFIKNACFVASKTNFSTLNYLKAKANAEIDFLASQKVAKPATEFISMDIQNPALYSILRKWREETAAASGAELYMVLPSRALVQLTEFLPRSTGALNRISGIGPAKIKQFGKVILEMIDKYCTENKITASSSVQISISDEKVKAKVVKIVKPESKKVTFDLFKEGKTVEEIAQERAMAVSTIEGHLGQYVSTGELDIYEVMLKTDIESIMNFYVSNNTKLVAEARIYFGEKYSYNELRLVVSYLVYKSASEEI